MTPEGESKLNHTPHPFVSIVLVTYNAAPWIRECIESLRKIDYPHWELVVVDNCSSDNTLDFVRMVASRVPLTALVRNDVDLGYAGACNVGYALSHGELIVFLGPDIVADESWVSNLVAAFLDDASIGAAQPALLKMGKPDIVDTVGQPIDALGFGYPTGGMRTSAMPSEISEIFYADGAALAVRRTAAQLASIQGRPFDHDYFLFFEETDLCWRLRLIGCRIVLVPQSRIYHARGTTSWVSGDPVLVFHHAKNRIMTLVKNYGRVRLVVYLPLLAAFDSARASALAATGHRAHALAVVRAYVYVFARMGQILDKRRTVQRQMRRVPDSHVTAFMKRVDVARLIRNFALYCLNQ